MSTGRKPTRGWRHWVSSSEEAWKLSAEGPAETAMEVTYVQRDHRAKPCHRPRPLCRHSRPFLAWAYGEHVTEVDACGRRAPSSKSVRGRLSVFCDSLRATPRLIRIVALNASQVVPASIFPPSPSSSLDWDCASFLLVLRPIDLASLFGLSLIVRPPSRPPSHASCLGVRITATPPCAASPTLGLKSGPSNLRRHRGRSVLDARPQNEGDVRDWWRRAHVRR